MQPNQLNLCRFLISYACGVRSNRAETLLVEDAREFVRKMDQKVFDVPPDASFSRPGVLRMPVLTLRLQGKGVKLRESRKEKDHLSDEDEMDRAYTRMRLHDIASRVPDQKFPVWDKVSELLAWCFRDLLRDLGEQTQTNGFLFNPGKDSCSTEQYHQFVRKRRPDFQVQFFFFNFFEKNIW